MNIALNFVNFLILIICKMPKTKQLYAERIGFMSSPILKKELEKHAENEGVKPAVILRKALVKYLKEQGVLKLNKNYL